MKRVAKQTVVVVRDGKSVTAPIGEPFDFTEEEVSQIEAMNPDAISAEAKVDLAQADADVKADPKKTETKKPGAGSTETL